MSLPQNGTPLANKRVLILGGTGSLGWALVDYMLREPQSIPAKIVVLSRDEAKQYKMRLTYQPKVRLLDPGLPPHDPDILEFRLGDVRDYHVVSEALRNIDIVINVAALKQIPSCEYFPFEAVKTNVVGAENIVQAIRHQKCAVHTVVSVSTDKACKPINVMGMTKSLMERIVLAGNLSCPATRFICVRFGNIMSSRGSVIPHFQEQISLGRPVTITTPEMTRFLMSLDTAVAMIINAICYANRGETFVPHIPAARIHDIATALIGHRDTPIHYIGIRPGEKTHEILIAEEECIRTYVQNGYYVIQPVLPELRIPPISSSLEYLPKEYNSSDNLLSFSELTAFLARHHLLGHPFQMPTVHF